MKLAIIYKAIWTIWLSSASAVRIDQHFLKPRLRFTLCICLPGITSPQIFGCILFQGMSVSMFLDEVKKWIVELTKADCPLQYRWVLSNLFTVSMELAGVWKQMNSLSVFELTRDWFFCLPLWTCASIYTLTFLDFKISEWFAEVLVSWLWMVRLLRFHSHMTMCQASKQLQK